MSTTGTTVTALADTLLLSILKLDASGLNWAIFSLHFQDAVEAKGYWGHFDSTTPWPAPTAPTVTPSPLPVVADGTTLGPQPDPAPTADDIAAMAQWDRDEQSAKSLTQKIPDSALMRICKAKTVKER